MITQPLQGWNRTSPQQLGLARAPRRVLGVAHAGHRVGKLVKLFAHLMQLSSAVSTQKPLADLVLERLCLRLELLRHLVCDALQLPVPLRFNHALPSTLHQVLQLKRFHLELLLCIVHVRGCFLQISGSLHGDHSPEHALLQLLDLSGLPLCLACHLFGDALKVPRAARIQEAALHLLVQRAEVRGLAGHLRVSLHPLLCDGVELSRALCLQQHPRKFSRHHLLLHRGAARSPSTIHVLDA
mmetsp:Transcript_57764/g.159735  ORF Transcript_57764/g.159735 Transcript_57764/m.159735 type:complete len:241 (+) Transcript_57764:309-1031(+)